MNDNYPEHNAECGCHLCVPPPPWEPSPVINVNERPTNYVEPQPPDTAARAALRALEECVGLCHASGVSWADIYAAASVAFAAAAGTPDPDPVHARLRGVLAAIIAAMEAGR